MGEQHVAGRSGRHPATIAVQQLGTQLPLEVADLLRQRRLSDVQDGRGTHELTLLGDGDEVAQMAELHISVKAILRITNNSLTYTRRGSRVSVMP